MDSWSCGSYLSFSLFIRILSSPTLPDLLPCHDSKLTDVIFMLVVYLFSLYYHGSSYTRANIILESLFGYFMKVRKRGAIKRRKFSENSVSVFDSHLSLALSYYFFRHNVIRKKTEFMCPHRTTKSTCQSTHEKKR